MPPGHQSCSPSRSMSRAAACRVSSSDSEKSSANTTAIRSTTALRLSRSASSPGSVTESRTRRPSFGSGLRMTRPRSSSTATVGPTACGVTCSARARSLALAGPPRSSRESVDCSGIVSSPDPGDWRNRRTNRPMLSFRAEATSFGSRVPSTMIDNLTLTSKMFKLDYLSLRASALRIRTCVPSGRGRTFMPKTAESDQRGAPDHAGPGDSSLRRRLFVPVLVLTGSLLAVVSSLGAPLIPTLSRAEGVSLSTGEWILTIALLTGALATPVMGRLADGPRQRDVILIPLGAVLAGCVLAAVSDGFTVLLIGRALQGLGLGLLPVLMAIARRNLPPGKARPVIATLSVTAVIGVGLGYPLTGLLAQALGFRAAYWFGAIAVAGAMSLAALVLPGRSAGMSRHFDVAGAGLLSLVVAGVSVVLSEGGEWGWSSARSLGLIVASAVLLAAWIPFELRSADPLVDLRQVRNRSVLTADVSGFLINASLYLLVIMIVEFVQIPRSAGYGFAASLVVSGLVLVPLSVCSFLASRFLAVYEQRFGRRTMIPLGSAVFAVAALFFAFEHA